VNDAIATRVVAGEAVTASVNLATPILEHLLRLTDERTMFGLA
jgi:hypothetical protein